MFAVIDEAVADPCTGWKCGQVARTHTVQVSVDPCVDFSFEHVNELFLVLFSVGPRRARTRRQALQVDTDANEAANLSQTTNWPHPLRTLRIGVRAFGQLMS